MDEKVRETTLARSDLGQIVLVFQGGGALGAYQAGAYQALHEAGVEPDWVIGTSIGAINASLIAGNAIKDRLPRLREFWQRTKYSAFTQLAAALPSVGQMAANGMTMVTGLSGIFEPNPWAFLSLTTPLGSERAAYYSTQPLRRTLEELVDTDRLTVGTPRLTVSAANVQSGEIRYFDSRKTPLTINHIMASSALPPAFPAVRIDGELYWDGGILSNTPIEAVFDDIPRRSGLTFLVHVWSPSGPEPDSILKVMARQKDLQYASRASSHITRQKQIHRLRRIIAELVKELPDDVRSRPDLKEMAVYGCLTRMHVVRLLAPPLHGEDHAKDIDFSPEGIRARWDAGYTATARVLTQKPWTRQYDVTEGFILHEAATGQMIHEA
jgi:NTE family protein